MTIIPVRVATLSARIGPAAVAAGVSLALFTWSQDALAKGKPPKVQDQSAVAQYRESIPTSSGPKLVGTGRTQSSPLGSGLQATISREGGQSAGLLTKVATSSAYGAPQNPLPRPPDRTRPADADAGTSIAAVPGSLFDSAGRSRMLGLLVVLVAVSLTAAAAARARS